MLRHTVVVLVASCAWVTAHAKDGVVVYGFVDGGVQYVSNIGGSSSYEASTGTMQPERFGLMGTESLGNGLTAEFRLEGGILTKEGRSVVAGRMFNRQASVGLKSEVGSLHFGRMPDLMYEYIPKFLSPPALTALVNKHPGNWDNYASQYQFANAVRVTTASYGGVSLALQYGFGTQPGDSKRARNMSAALAYSSGGLRAAMVYSEHRDRPVDIRGKLGVEEAFGQTLPAGAPVVADWVRNFALGASYRMDTLMFAGAYSKTQMSWMGQRAKQDNYDLGVSWNVTPKNTLQATYTYSKFDSAKWHQLTLTAIHGLSKRTYAYVQSRLQRAGGSADYASIADIGVSSSRSQAVVSLGLAHRF